jgi:hypothetical protein
MAMAVPQREEDVLERALLMAEYLERHGNGCRPPLSPATLRAMVADITARRTRLAKGERRHVRRRVRQQCELAQVQDALKRQLMDLDRAELMGLEMGARPQPDPNGQPARGGRAGASDREPPGVARDPTATRVGDTSVLLQWGEPDDGGPAAAYRVHRRQAGGFWTRVATVKDNDCLLRRQPWPAEFELRVVAVNRAGAGRPSAAVTV